MVDFRYLQLFIAILLAFTNGDESVESDESDESNETIFGGKDAKCRIGYQVSLEYGGYHLCSGALLSQYWIVTTASCVNSGPDAIAVGSNILKSPSMMKYNISALIPHKMSNISVYYNIGLVRSAEKIYGGNIKYLTLPEKDVKPLSRMIITGWVATTYSDGGSPNQLQILSTKSISPRECKYRFNITNKIPNVVLCTYTKAGRSSCSREKGSPVVRHNILYGIVTSIYPCARGAPDTSIRINTMTSWIANTFSQFM